MSTIKKVFEAGKGILQLTPTWVPRGFNEPTQASPSSR